MVGQVPLEDLILVRVQAPQLCEEINKFGGVNRTSPLGGDYERSNRSPAALERSTQTFGGVNRRVRQVIRPAARSYDRASPSPAATLSAVRETERPRGSNLLVIIIFFNLINLKKPIAGQFLFCF